MERTETRGIFSPFPENLAIDRKKIIREKGRGIYTHAMEREVALRWSWMNVLNRKRWDALAGRFGSLEAALGAVDIELLRSLGCREDTALLAMNRLEEFDPETYERELEKREISLITFEDEEYPALLKEIPDAPSFLYARGDLSILAQPCIALVGARAMSEYGSRVVAHLVPLLITAGTVTVSGLAEGIDAEVASETLHAGGRTVAVLGHGLGMMYPKAHERLAASIVEKGGLIISEFPLDIRPDHYTFPARNRIIAGLSLGTIIVEAAEESGSLITADLALDYNREVFAVPGQIFDPGYAGCHQILKRGQASLITSAQDVLTALGIVGSTAPESSIAPTFDSAEEQAIFGVLTSMPQSLDDLVEKTGFDAATLNATLTMLELKGIAKNVGNGRWVRH
jgi:DNA processing protein